MRHRTRAHVAVLPASVVIVALVSTLVGIQGCGKTAAPATQPCDQTCMDQTAVRSLREGLKLIFNDTLQGQDVGVQDSGTVPCPLGGTAHVFGTATSNAAQGSTMVNLTYVLDHCVNLQTDSDPTQTYDVTFTGTITEVGVIAVQPSSTTSLALESDSMTLTGTVEDPPLDYQATACPVALEQNGNNLAGTMCGRAVGLTL